MSCPPSRHAHSMRLVVSLAAVAAVGACQQQSPRLRANATVSAACRAEVDRVYAAQNRVDLSRQDQRDSPFAANFVRGDTTRGLGAEFGRDNQYAACVANSGAASGGPTPATSGPASTIGPAFTPASR